ncbi:hypothetical protein ACROYT_G036527 [Oculina patagonica]
MMENATVYMLFTMFQGMLYFLVVAADTTASSTLSRSSYFTTRENKRLEGHVVKRFESPSLLSCGQQCMRNEWCSSANFKVSTNNDDKGTCELNKHNSSVVHENTKFHDQEGVIFLTFLKGCRPFDSNENCFITGKSCQDIKRVVPHAPDGMYRIQPDSRLNTFWAYCDMTSFSGGWTMCYSTNNIVNPKAEVTYDASLPYGTNGYRTDCNNIPFREILFVDEATGQKAFFTYKLNSTLIAAENYGAQLPARWLGKGVADTSYEYQLLICDTHFYSGFFISGYTNCYKICNSWCGDTGSPYFRSASTAVRYAGIAFNINGHYPRSSRLISVGLR